MRAGERRRRSGCVKISLKSTAPPLTDGHHDRCIHDDEVALGAVITLDTHVDRHVLFDAVAAVGEPAGVELLARES